MQLINDTVWAKEKNKFWTQNPKTKPTNLALLNRLPNPYELRPFESMLLLQNAVDKRRRLSQREKQIMNSKSQN